MRELMKRLAIILWSILLLFLVLTIVLWNLDDDKAERKKEAGSLDSLERIRQDQEKIAQENAIKEAREKQFSWVYAEEMDQLTLKKDHWAMVESEIKFKAGAVLEYTSTTSQSTDQTVNVKDRKPTIWNNYSKEKITTSTNTVNTTNTNAHLVNRYGKVTLTLRKYSNKPLDIFIGTEEGKLINYGYINIRFGKKKVEKFNVTTSYDSRYFFIHPSNKFLKELKKVDSVFIEIYGTENGRQIFPFRARNLNWAYN